MENLSFVELDRRARKFGLRVRLAFVAVDGTQFLEVTTRRGRPYCEPRFLQPRDVDFLLHVKEHGGGR